MDHLDIEIKVKITGNGTKYDIIEELRNIILALASDQNTELEYEQPNLMLVTKQFSDKK